MNGRNGALRFELNPFEPPDSVIGQPVQGSIKAWGFAVASMQVPKSAPFQGQSASEETQWGFIRDAQLCHGIAQLFAIMTEDGLNKEIEPAVGFTRDLGPIAAPGTFK